MRIVAVSGSPRKNGNTDLILKEALSSAKEEGAEISLIRICDYELKPCSACASCFETKKCIIDDDCEKLYGELVAADGIILGSPSYFQGVTAQMKIFIDRIGYLGLARGRNDFAGKVGGVIAVARRSGVASTCSQMLALLTAMRITIPGGGRVFAIAREKGEVMKDKEGVETAKYLGKMLVKLAKTRSE